MAAQRTVLFVCVGNAGRSVMAEAIFNSRAPKVWGAASAGVSPARATNPGTGPCLEEIGVRAPSHPPQALTEKAVREATICVSIGALEHPTCPEWFAQAHPLRWTIPDTHGADLQEFRAIREMIRAEVEALIARLSENSPRVQS